MLSFIRTFTFSKKCFEADENEVKYDKKTRTQKDVFVYSQIDHVIRL